MFNRTIRTNFLLFLLLILISSCKSTRDITYLSNLKNTSVYTEEIKNSADTQIQTNDLLNITVSSLSPESNMLFNSGVMQPASASSAAGVATRTNDGYLVDKNGAVNFPVLGSIKLAGLTKEQATTKMVNEIKNYVKNPIVNIRFMNFKITVVGEVNRPSTFTIPTDRINVLEALGLAGDMTAFGRRDNVLIIREKEGVRNVYRLDLTNKEVLNSPNYYLQQNDVLYVEAVKVKSLQSSSSTFYIPLISAAISLLSLLIVIAK